MRHPDHASKRRRSTRGGFSLTEVIVVLAIIMIASSIALSSYASYARYSAIESTARDLRRALLFARSASITRRIDTILHFDVSRQAYWTDEEDPSAGTRRNKIVEARQPAAGIRIVSVQVDSTTQTAGTLSARFNPNGENPLVKVLLKRDMDPAGRDDSYYTVLLHPASDDVRILERERR